MHHKGLSISLGRGSKGGRYLGSLRKLREPLGVVGSTRQP